MFPFKTAAACLLTFAMVSPGSAAPMLLPQASFKGSILGGDGVKNFNGLGGLDYSDQFGEVHASIASSPILTLQGSGKTTNVGLGHDGPITSAAETRAVYYFVLLAASPTQVHVFFDTFVTAAGFGSYFTDSTVFLNANDGSSNTTLAHAHSCSNGPGCGTGSNKVADGGHLEYTIQANKIYSMTMMTSGRATWYDSSWATYADPVISLNPAYTAPSDLRFQVSSNIPQQLANGLFSGISPATDAVPEPASWALMLFGFGAIGATLRTGRKAHSPDRAAAS